MIPKIRRMLCGKAKRVEPTEHQRLVLDLCTRVQRELSQFAYGPLEVSEVELDLTWRAILTLLRGVPPSPDDHSPAARCCMLRQDS
jgi:hypothetical protein